MTSSVPKAVTRPDPTMGPHPLFREASAKSYKWEVAPGNNAAPTTTNIAVLQADYAGLYSVILETGNNISFGWFRIDDSGTVNLLGDVGGALRSVATNGTVAIVNNAGTLQINNRLGGALTAVPAALTITRHATA